MGKRQVVVSPLFLPEKSRKKVKTFFKKGLRKFQQGLELFLQPLTFLLLGLLSRRYDINRC
jgi:hypothetical protein